MSEMTKQVRYLHGPPNEEVRRRSDKIVGTEIPGMAFVLRSMISSCLMLVHVIISYGVESSLSGIHLRTEC